MLAAPTFTASALATAIFAKTDKGRAEVAQRGASLSTRQRSVLIMLDGRKTAQSLTSLVPAEQLAVILDELAALDMIVTVAAAVATPTPTPVPASTLTPAPAPTSTSKPTPAPAPAAAPADPARLSSAKSILIRSAETCLGPIAADLIRQIGAACDEHQLQRAIGHWHMAMRDSKYGREVADAHLAQVKASLRGPVSVPG